MVNPNCQVVGVSLNTSAMSDADSLAYCAEVEKRMGLPTVDPFRHGAARLVEGLTGA
jgi:uncharacterized NAD-dependent epimerase/dehydratase family protein